MQTIGVAPSFQVAPVMSISSVRQRVLLIEIRYKLKTQYTVLVICNPKHLNNNQRTDRTMHIFFNAGVKTTDMVGDMSGVGEVWYHSEGIANIISMSLIQKDYQVTYDIRLDNNFRVWNEEKQVPRIQAI